MNWIKIMTNLFDNDKIILIESMPNPYPIIVVWIKILCLAGKEHNDGIFMMGGTPYTVKMFAAIFHMREKEVSRAFAILQQFSMIELIDDVVTIPNWDKYQSSEAYEKKRARDRKYQAERRAKQKELARKSSDKSSDVACLEADTDSESDLESDSQRESIFCQQIVDLFNSICQSLPHVNSLSEARKTEIRNRSINYTLSDFKEVFKNAEASSFLRGENKNHWQATFDWLIKEANMAKVLDGNYADPPKQKAAIWGCGEMGAAEMEAIARVLKSPEEDDPHHDAAADQLISAECTA